MRRIELSLIRRKKSRFMSKMPPSLAIVFLAPIAGLCQDSGARPIRYQMCHAMDINPSMYQSFFEEMKDFGQRPLSAEVYVWLNLSDHDRDSVIAIARDLADQSCIIDRAIRPLIWEARMEAIESRKVSPRLHQKLQDLQAEWDQDVADHVQQLNAALGETRFLLLGEFLRTGKSIYETPVVLAPRRAVR